MNPRAAVPIYTRSRTDTTAGRIDLVVPISLTPEPHPDAALVIERTVDPRANTPCYLVRRLLDLKWARAQARAIMPVDQDWLDVGIPGGIHAYGPLLRTLRARAGARAPPCLTDSPPHLRVRVRIAFFFFSACSTVFGSEAAGPIGHHGPPQPAPNFVDPW